jgi:pimeloyl-ACP methyl ester carboxylesterase
MADVVFIHGAWVGPRCWDGWARAYRAEGLSSIAPPWPYDELRRAPDARLAAVGVGEIVDHYAQIIRTLPQPPILVGHSFGGLVVQLLVSRGLGSAGVAINPGPPRGVLPTPRALVTALPVLAAWRGWRRILSLTYPQFVGGFVHELAEGERRRAFEEQTLPPLLSGGVCALPSRDAGRLSPRRSRAAADHRRRARPHGAGGDEPRQPARLSQVAGRDRLPRIQEAQPLDHRRARLGRSGRIRPEMGARED